MRLTSLRLRLAAAAGLAILAALTLSGVFLNLLFQRHVERRVESELSVHVKQLAALIEIAADGSVELASPLADPRFERPLSGLYWQVDGLSGPGLRSRSLFDQALALPELSPIATDARLSEAVGPDGETLLTLSRVVFLAAPGGADTPLRLTAAVDQAEIREAQRAFALELLLAFSLLALALLAASIFQILVGLRPLRVLQRKVRAIRGGEAERLEGEYPSEVRLLVDEMNALLDANDKMIERAREGAADLAHGLKTPLAVLQAESRKLAEEGRAAEAAEIADQIAAMRDRVERHLAVVRMRGPGGGRAGRTDLRASFEKLIRAMQVMPRGEAIDWRLDVSEEIVAAPIDTQDFFEVFGNLLDNARKWAASAVEIRIARGPAGWTIAIADDGPGVPEKAIGEILKRGGRLDERRTGAGLGLSIAARVLEAYGGALTVSNRSRAEGGGALVVVSIPVRTAP